MLGKRKVLEDEEKEEGTDEHGESKRKYNGRSSLNLSLDLSLVHNPYFHQSLSQASPYNKSVSNESETETDFSLRPGNSKGLENQLTIFYNGTVQVYETTALKANTIMRLASTICGKQSPTDLTQTSAPSTPFTNFMFSPKTPSLSNSCSSPGNMPLASKSSLQRFLAKRGDRLQGLNQRQ